MRKKRLGNLRLDSWNIACSLFILLFFDMISSCKDNVEPKTTIEEWHPTLDNIIPKPMSIVETGDTFFLAPTTKIWVEAGSSEGMKIGQYLSGKLNPSTGYEIEVLTATKQPDEGIYITTAGTDPSLGEEGYELTVTKNLVTISAYQPAGLFYGTQTLRQLFSPSIESSLKVEPIQWIMATGAVKDIPRFNWRGAMLDVSRHFFNVNDVKNYIDLLCFYKINRLHLHLSDDQGWRIEIFSWPNLTTLGGSTEVGGGSGGYYTQEDFAEIVAYAQDRYIMVIPEIDMPGHTNAALASYAELNCNGNAPAPYTGTNVGFSSLCIDKEITYTFIDDVIKEIAAITPGPYIHIGGDEAQSTSFSDYVKFIDTVQTIVNAHGKYLIGWEDVAAIQLHSTSVIQHWIPNNSTNSLSAVNDGAKIIMSPANFTYLDMKYNSNTELGLTWAGTINVQKAYEWNPATQINGVSEESILGVEAPLWTETIDDFDDIEYMAFPRLIGVAEVGWSRQSDRNWEDYQRRLATHGPRLTQLGVNYYRSPLVPW